MREETQNQKTSWRFIIGGGTISSMSNPNPEKIHVSERELQKYFHITKDVLSPGGQRVLISLFILLFQVYSFMMEVHTQRNTYCVNTTRWFHLEYSRIGEAMIFKMFANNFEGPALTWQYSLKLRSIDSFGDLSISFQGQFSLSMKVSKKPNQLFSMVQHKNQLLRSYTQCFNNKMLEVTDFHDSVAMQTFRKGLINGTPFDDFFTMRTPKKVVDVLSQVSEFVKLEND